MDSREALVALNLIEGVGPVRVRQLLEHFGEAPARNADVIGIRMRWVILWRQPATPSVGVHLLGLRVVAPEGFVEVVKVLALGIDQIAKGAGQAPSSSMTRFQSFEAAASSASDTLARSIAPSRCD